MSEKRDAVLAAHAARRKQIHYAYLYGASMTELAKEFKVSRTRVHQIIKFEQRRDVRRRARAHFRKDYLNA